jgi:hypothetical protein
VLRGVMIVLWRAGRRTSEALALPKTDLDRQRAAILVRAGKGGRRREVGMDRWGGGAPRLLAQAADVPVSSRRNGRRRVRRYRGHMKLEDRRGVRNKRLPRHAKAQTEIGKHGLVGSRLNQGEKATRCPALSAGSRGRAGSRKL